MSGLGLFAAPSLAETSRVAAPASFELTQPVAEGGVTVFRQSLWCTVPATARAASALLLAEGSALALRFEPLQFDVPTSDRHWFPSVHTDREAATVRVEMAWPAVLHSVPDAPMNHGIAFEIFRVDGRQRAAQPTQNGRTGSALSPPWVGSPLELHFTEPMLLIGTGLLLGNVSFAPKAAAPAATTVKAAAPAAPGTVAAGPGPAVDAAALQAAREPSMLAPSLRLRGAPTSPRLKLWREARGGAEAVLLWQALLPGEQEAVTLPAEPLPAAWAAALEQVRALLADESPADGAPLRLRLDIESDAPCRVRLTQSSLALEAEWALLEAEWRADFDGTAERDAPLPLPWPAGTVRGLTLAGRVDGGTLAPAGAAALSGAARRGLLLQPGSLVRVHAVLPAPQSTGGVLLAWHPLSDAVVLKMRWLADAGDRPSATPLLPLQVLRLPTPAGGVLALRAPRTDLQSGHLWLELGVDEGRALWLADEAAPVPTQGWVEEREGGAAPRRPLGLQPAWAWLPPPAPAPAAGAPEPPRAVSLLAGTQAWASQLDERFTLACPPPLLAAAVSQGLRLRSGSAARVTVSEARVRIELA